MIPILITTWENRERCDRFYERWHEAGGGLTSIVIYNVYKCGKPDYYHGSSQSYGCKLSHVEALIKASQRHDHALIMEDDAIVTRDALETIAEIERSVKFDVMLLGSMNRLAHDRPHASTVNGHAFSNVTAAMGTHAMLIHRDRIQRVLSVAMKADRDLGDYYSIHLYRHLNTLAMTPSIIVQDTTLPSSIPDSYNKQTVKW